MRKLLTLTILLLSLVGYSFGQIGGGGGGFGGGSGGTSVGVPGFDQTHATLYDVFDLHEGSGVTLTGSLHGKTCTLAGQTATDPIWSGNSLVFSAATTSFITCTGMTTPVIVQVIASYIPVTTPQFQTLAGVDSAVTSGFSFIPTPSGAPSITPHFTLGFNAGGTLLGVGSVGNGIQALTLAISNTGSYIYINKDNITSLTGVASLGNVVPPVGANFTIGGSLGQASCAPHACQFHSGSIYGFAVYSTNTTSKANTDSLVAQNYQAWSNLLQTHAVSLGSYVTNNPSTITSVIVEGTSIEAGVGSGTPVCTNASTGLSANYTCFNLGVPSSYLAAIVNGNSQIVDFGNVPTAGRKIVYHGNAVTNDMALGATTPAVGYQLLQRAVANDWSRLNPAYVLVGTQMSRTGQDTVRDTWNGSVRLGPTASRYRLCDIAANPLLGADGAFANTTYFGDGVHPTAAGQLIQAGILGRCVQYYDGATEANPTVSAVDAYVMTVADAYLTHTPTVAGTPTLPECIGLTGNSFTIFNASPTIADVFSTTASETVIGSNALPALTSAKFSVQFNGPTTAGCSWLRIK